jgi:membrane protease YdiL (CAAX protease family)
VLLRGVLLDRIQRAGGLVSAVILTSAVFALMHVPLYGWHVVPLDFAVGLGLAGLRLTTRGLVAPAIAHVVADLATWWL